MATADRQRQGRRVADFGRDAEDEFVFADDGAAEEPAGKRPRGALLAVGQLVELVRELIEKQTGAAKDLKEKARPNESITGDAYVRTAFQTVLSNQHQRELFLETASVPQNWPRLKPLFGAPPYHFLFADDANMLRATGVSRGRVNMVYDTQDPVSAL